MNFKNILFVLLLVPVFSSAQLIEGTGEKVDLSKIKAWLPTNSQEYQSVYHFGNSELESQFILIVTPTIISAQISAGKWERINGNDCWVLNFENLRNVRIEGNKFYSDETAGEFVTNGSKHGLIIYSPWRSSAQTGEHEIGYPTCPLNKQFYGKYTYASYRLLETTELQQRKTSELQLIRNEIFARYGYIFKPGSTMDKYFRKQSWYGGSRSDVSAFLTDIEKWNIELIQRIENDKK